MKVVRLVFVQAGSSDVKKLGTLLGSIPQKEYFFVIMPPEGMVLTKKEALAMLETVK